jgi:hypothetical protein
MHYEGDKPKIAEDRHVARRAKKRRRNVYCEEPQAGIWKKQGICQYGAENSSFIIGGNFLTKSVICSCPGQYSFWSFRYVKNF